MLLKPDTETKQNVIMKRQAAEILPDFFLGSKDPKAKNDDLPFMIFNGIPDGFVLI